MIETEFCPVCQKSVNSIFMENHHYIPISQGGTANDTIRLCGTCHDILHYYIPIDRIHQYKTASDIRDIPELSVYLEWIKTKNHAKWGIRSVIYKLRKLAS
jgi:hypothetical protein